MILLEKILDHYSAGEKILPRAVLKEYLQYKILQIVFSSKYGDKMIFMGGTSVRLVSGNDRFSEDIDLDNTGLSSKNFDELMDIVKLDLEREGLKVEIRNTHKDVYHCYFKFPGLLFNNRLSPLKDEKILIQIDSFHSKEKIKPILKIISKADIFTEVRVYPIDIILSQKIFAAFNRKRAKGRDLYDIVYLFSLTEPNWNYLNKHLKIKDKNTLVKKMGKLFTDKELSALATDVEPFLINPKNIIRVTKFNKWLKTL